MKTGVYGGTFNPIHLGHLHILKEFTARLGLDRVLLVPAGVPPHKAAPALAPGQDRAMMCGLAVREADLPARVSTIELDRPGKSFTSDTLLGFRERFPQDEFFLLMGEDMFLTVDSWHQADTIFRLSSLCASPRSQDGLSKLLKKRQALEALGARCFVEDIPFWDVSSTQVRQLAAQGGGLEELTPRSVADYIRQHRLYCS